MVSASIKTGPLHESDVDSSGHSANHSCGGMNEDLAVMSLKMSDSCNDDDDDGTTTARETEPLLTKKQARCYIPKRYEVIAMCFVGMGIMFLMRINVSVTMVAMTNATFTSSDGDDANNYTTETCSVANITEDETPKGGEFSWSARDQELILAGFFYGYSLCQIPAGWLTDKIGGTRVFCVSMFLSGAFNLLSPVAAHTSATVLLVTRILCGIGEAGMNPALGSLITRWFPSNERSRSFTLAMSGAKFGTVVGTILSGLLSDSNIMGGWPSTYYFFGMFAVFWSILWTLLIYETPAKHPRISVEERCYLETTTIMSEKSGKIKIPVKAILTSIPVWAIVVCSFIGAWTNYTIFTNMPIYLKHVQGMDITQIGFLSSLPFLAEGTMLILGGIIGDALINRHTCTVLMTRKLLTFIGMTMTSLSFVLLAYARCSSALAIIFMTAAVGFNGLCTGGYYVNMMDIAPQLAGSVVGFVSTASALAGALSPYVVSVFTTNQADIRGWQTVFWIAGGVNMIGCFVFIIFGSGKEQEWAKHAKDEEDNDA